MSDLALTHLPADLSFRLDLTQCNESTFSSGLIEVSSCANLCVTNMRGRN